MDATGKYVYGIIVQPEQVRFDIRGIENGPVYTVNHGELAALVSDTELAELDPTRKNVLAHRKVQDAFLNKYTLLPMGFGMVASSADDVRTMLVRNYAVFLQELERLHGKIEVELTIFWDQGAMIKELESQTPELRHLKAKLASAPSTAKSQSLLIEAGRLVERIVNDWKARYTTKVLCALKELAEDTRQNQPLSIRNMLNASFLIDRSAEGRFKEEVHKLDSEYRGKVDFKYVGPLPPYNFVNVRLAPVKS